MKHTRLTDKEIIALWRNRSGPINIAQDFDPDISYPCIKGVSFELNTNGESYISSVTFEDPNRRSFINVSPRQIYTGPLRRKFSDSFS